MDADYKGYSVVLAFHIPEFSKDVSHVDTIRTSKAN